MSVLLICAFLLSACGGPSYDSYGSAYNRLWAKGGINANITADLQMEGETRHFTGNFKVSNPDDLLYFEMEGSGGKTIQFSDGQYLYTIQGDNKTKYSLQGSSNRQPTQEENEITEAPEFSVSDFLDEFSSMFEASKIKDLGLFDPIPKAAVTKTTKNGDVYTLDVSDTIVQRFLNNLATSQSQSGDTVQVTKMQNFKYTATVKDSVVTAQTFSGIVTVKVPASLINADSDKEYQINFTINMDFVDPGSAVSITIPSTDDFEEISGM